MQCLEEETVVALLHGELDGSALHQVEEHIDACAACRQLVSRLAELGDEAPRITSASGVASDVLPSGKPADAPFPPGTTVVGGRFELEGLASSGGMGHIYRARDRQTGALVAVKRVDVDEARFGREARVLADLAHPAIVRYVADGRSEDGTRYLAMEWLDGEDLAQRLARGPLTVEQTLRLGMRVADGLGTAHARGVVHRDVKPSNLFLEGGDPERVKVVDFGVARANVVGATRTRTGALLGTPGYMAPEQAKGETAIGPRADVFALGCVLYECLTGTRAFRGANVIAVLANLFTAKAPRPRAVAPHVPRALDAYVARMLSRDPNKRPSDGAEVLRDLRAIGSASVRGRVTALGRPESVLRVVGGVALGVCLFGGAALLHARLSGSPHAATPPVAIADAAPQALAITDFPAPEGTRPDAAAEYAAGLKALRDAALEQAKAHLTRATELDPDLAEAHLRLSVWTDAFMPPEESRAHFRAARANRARMRERDRDFLDAIEPEALSEPPNQAETERRVLALPAKHPGDAELLLLAAGTGTMRSAPAEYERVLAVDPRFAYAWWGRARATLAAGDTKTALASVDACLDVAPGSTMCRLMRTRIDAENGDCVGMERDARAVIALENGSDYGYLRLAHALFANGAPRESVHEALRQRVAAAAPVERERVRHYDEAQLAAAFGDFPAAEASARALARTTDPARFEQDHVPAALILVDVLDERGDTGGAGAVADAFLRRRSGWRTLAGRPYDDPRPLFLAAARRAGLRSREEELRARDAWINEWREKIGEPGAAEIWLEGWARPARDPREGEAAIAALPAGVVPAKIAPAKGWIWPPPFSLTGGGRALVLGGHGGDAVAVLQRVTRDCGALTDAVGHTQAHLALGQALEATGDTAGACAAYAVVLKRWSAARPRSVSAERARGRSEALGCARP